MIYAWFPEAPLRFSAYELFIPPILLYSYDLYSFSPFHSIFLRIHFRDTVLHVDVLAFSHSTKSFLLFQ